MRRLLRRIYVDNVFSYGKITETHCLPVPETGTIESGGVISAGTSKEGAGSRRCNGDE